MDSVNHLGTRLKQLRGDRPLNQIEMASGINRGQLRRYEEGRIPEEKQLLALCAFYNVPYEELKALCFEDLYPLGSQERNALIRWALKAKQK